MSRGEARFATCSSEVGSVKFKVAACALHVWIVDTRKVGGIITRKVYLVVVSNLKRTVECYIIHNQCFGLNNMIIVPLRNIQLVDFSGYFGYIEIITFKIKFNTVRVGKTRKRNGVVKTACGVVEAKKLHFAGPGDGEGHFVAVHIEFHLAGSVQGVAAMHTSYGRYRGVGIQAVVCDAIAIEVVVAPAMGQHPPFLPVAMSTM